MCECRNVHITLVIHPRKEEEGKAMSMMSVFGSAKMTQEADLVMILQKGESVLRPVSRFYQVEAAPRASSHEFAAWLATCRVK